MPSVGAKSICQNIKNIFDSRRQEAEVIAAEMAKEALDIFRSRQFASDHKPGKKIKADSSSLKARAMNYAEANAGGTPKTNYGDAWINRSFRAARTVFPYHDSDEEFVCFGLYHTMSYGVYLELAHGRKYAILEPIVRGLSDEFIERVGALYAD